MSKRKPSTAKANADRIFSRIIRLHGACENCGSTDTLQCAHWISRRYAWTRTYSLNAFCLCAGCHRWFTDHPTEWGRWTVERRGEAVYQHVLERSRRRDKFDWLFEEERLKAELKLLEDMRAGLS